MSKDSSNSVEYAVVTNTSQTLEVKMQHDDEETESEAEEQPEIRILKEFRCFCKQKVTEIDILEGVIDEALEQLKVMEKEEAQKDFMLNFWKFTAVCLMRENLKLSKEIKNLKKVEAKTNEVKTRKRKFKTESDDAVISLKKQKL